MKCDSDVAGSPNSPCLATDNVFLSQITRDPGKCLCKQSGGTMSVLSSYSNKRLGLEF